MRLGYVMVPGQGETDRTLTAVAEAGLARGLPLLAAVQHNTDCGYHCDMDLRILPGDTQFRISQNLGEESSGCRLDPAGLEAAVAEVAARLSGAGVLIVNKFGKQEAEGRGMAPLIADALERNLPVLLGVNGLNLPAFQTFAGGLETALAADIDQVVEWCVSAGYHLHEPAR